MTAPDPAALLAAMEAAAHDAGAEQWTLYLGEDGDPIAVVTYDPQPSKRLHVVSHPLYPKDRAKAERRTLFVATANPAAVLQLCAALRASQEREAQAVAALEVAEAALADIGDAEREASDNVAWCEARAAKALPVVRAAIRARKDAAP